MVFFGLLETFRLQKFQKLDFWDKFFFFLDLFTKTMPQNNRRGPFTAWSCMFHLVLRRICKSILCVCVRERGGGGDLSCWCLPLLWEKPAPGLKLRQPSWVACLTSLHLHSNRAVPLRHACGTVRLFVLIMPLRMQREECL